jgi:hypothetical protein
MKAKTFNFEQAKSPHPGSVVPPFSDDMDNTWNRRLGHILRAADSHI